MAPAKSASGLPARRQPDQLQRPNAWCECFIRRRPGASGVGLFVMVLLLCSACVLASSQPAPDGDSGARAEDSGELQLPADPLQVSDSKQVLKASTVRKRNLSASVPSLRTVPIKESQPENALTGNRQQPEASENKPQPEPTTAIIQRHIEAQVSSQKEYATSYLTTSLLGLEVLPTAEDLPEANVTPAAVLQTKAPLLEQAQAAPVLRRPPTAEAVPSGARASAAVTTSTTIPDDLLAETSSSDRTKAIRLRDSQILRTHSRLYGQEPESPVVDSSPDSRQQLPPLPRRIRMKPAVDSVGHSNSSGHANSTGSLDTRSSLLRSRTTSTSSRLSTSTRRLPEPHIWTSAWTTVVPTVSSKNSSTPARILMSSPAPLPPESPEFTTIPEAAIILEADEPGEAGLLEEEQTTLPPSIEASVSTKSPFVERPAGLEKELLAAIRRKMSKTTNKPKATTTKRPDSSGEPDPSLSPASLLGSPVAPSTPEILAKEEDPQPKQNIMVRPSHLKEGSPVKIPDLSHIQGKLAKLNAAISEGLHQQRIQDLVPNSTTLTSLNSTVISYIASQQRTSASTTSSRTVSPALKLPTSSTPWPEPLSQAAERSATSKVLSVSEIINFSKAHTSPVPEYDLQSSSSPFSPSLPALSAIAVKTHTYLDVLRERQLQHPDPAFTSTRPTATVITTPSTSTVRTPMARAVSRKVVAIEPQPTEHPSSHFRPSPSHSNQGRVIVSPMVGDSVPNVTTPDTNPSVSQDIGEQVIPDVTGTTVYVVSVICIVPAAGLIAWLVRYLVKGKNGASASENGSETGLNCPLGVSAEDEVQAQASASATTTAVSANVVLASTAGHNLPMASAAVPGCQIISELVDADDMAELPEGLSAVSSWQLARKNLRFLTVLGEGNFGKVWKAEAEDICGMDGPLLVAVKTTKEKCLDKEKSDLLQEMKVMQKIGHHPNVVTLLGICTEKEPFLLVMEYVRHGKLLTHLREQRSRQISLFQFSEADLQGESGDQTKISSKDLTKYAYGVAKGMEFLVAKGIIHRDLAARNILLDHSGCCKISDFGLSRSLADTGSEMYEQKTKGALPIRWMAPESLYFSVFTPKSDVWSFGILMWEIVTLGSTPYPGMGAREVMRRVRDGYRLERPSHCHPEFYKIIAKCWSGDMNKRPDFSELRQELAKLLEDQHGYIDLQNIPESTYYSMTQNSNEEEKI